MIHIYDKNPVNLWSQTSQKALWGYLDEVGGGEEDCGVVNSKPQGPESIL